VIEIEANKTKSNMRSTKTLIQLKLTRLFTLSKKKELNAKRINNNRNRGMGEKVGRD
jgi:hypothetical protein